MFWNLSEVSLTIQQTKWTFHKQLILTRVTWHLLWLARHTCEHWLTCCNFLLMQKYLYYCYANKRVPVAEIGLCSACAYPELSQVVQTEDIVTSGKLLVKDDTQKMRHEVNLDQGSGLIYSPCLVRFLFFFFLLFSDIFSVTHNHWLVICCLQDSKIHSES